MSNRDDCIAMWKYIAKHDCTKLQYFSRTGLKRVTSLCYACVEAEDRFQVDCNECPVDWGTLGYPASIEPCIRDGSPYAIWSLENSSKNARKVLKTIKDTWRE